MRVKSTLKAGSCSCGLLGGVVGVVTGLVGGLLGGLLGCLGISL